MDLSTLTTIVSGIIVGGGTTTVVTEILKLSFIPVAAQKYPRITAGVVSLVAGVISLMVAGLDFSSATTFAQAVPTAIATFLVSVFAYNQVVAGLKKPQV